MMMGTAGELAKPPPKPVQFVEDMTDAELNTAVSSRKSCLVSNSHTFLSL